jgi:type 1 glutamine amidotransferase
MFVISFSLLLFISVQVYTAPTVVQAQSNSNQSKILVFFKTISYFHESIPNGIDAIRKLGEQNGFGVDITNIASYFTVANLQQYSAVVFMSTNGQIFNNEQQAAFESYYRTGKGFVGIHAAADTEYSWPWYNGLLGAYFANHPSVLQNATFNIVDQNFIATKHLTKQWKRYDELYNYQKTLFNTVHVLITIDESSYYGGDMGKIHPISWYQNYDGGRSFYSQMSHQIDSYSDTVFMQYILGGIQYAMTGKTT